MIDNTYTTTATSGEVTLEQVLQVKAEIEANSPCRDIPDVWLFRIEEWDRIVRNLPDWDKRHPMLAIEFGGMPVYITHSEEEYRATLIDLREEFAGKVGVLAK